MPRADTITARTMIAFITVNARSRARSSSWPVSKKLMATAKPAAAKAGPLSSPINMAPRKVIGRRQAGNQQARHDDAADVGAVAARLLPHDGKPQPRGHEGRGDGAEAQAEHIGAELGRREQPRENHDIDKTKRRRKDVGGEIDRGLSDKHGLQAIAWVY